MQTSPTLSKLIPQIGLIVHKQSKKTASSSQWINRHLRDPFVKRAVKETYRARSAFKLIEINDRFNFLKEGDVVVDLGACPGSWSQVAIKLVNSDGSKPDKPKGFVISVDREFIEDLGSGARCLSYCDINDSKTIDKIIKELNGKKANCVISDMAPNATGQATLDHDAILVLQKDAFNLTTKILEKNGNFLFKIWFGDSANKLRDDLLKHFELVKFVKPNSSRKESAEVFVFCTKYKPAS